MKDLAIAYIEYLMGLKQIKKPEMPTFDLSAYNDIEYIRASHEIVEDYTNVDDDSSLVEYEKFLKGE